MFKPTWPKAPYDSTFAQRHGPHILKPSSPVRISAIPGPLAARTATSWGKW
jgi:hypothetical protein